MGDARSTIQSMDDLINANSPSSHKFRHCLSTSRDGETEFTIWWPDHTSTQAKIADLPVAVDSFLSTSPGSYKFVVIIGANKSDHRTVSVLFPSWIITRTVEGHLVFRRKSAM